MPFNVYHTFILWEQFYKNEAQIWPKIKKQCKNNPGWDLES